MSIYQNQNILIVDDEAIILSSFKATFKESFTIFTATSAKEGFEILQNHDINIVVSDYKMPEKDGVIFLSEVHQMYPLASKILLTAIHELQIAIDAINIGCINKFVCKPWVYEELNSTLNSCMEINLLKKDKERLMERLSSNERLIELIENKNNKLPTSVI